MKFQISGLLVFLIYFSAFNIFPIYSSDGIFEGRGNLNETCEDNRTCTTDNSYCPIAVPPEDTAKCTCFPDTIGHNSSTPDCSQDGILSCLPVVNFVGEKCNVNSQCTAGYLGEMSYCSDGKCQCLPNAILTSGKRDYCLELAANLGDYCEVNADATCTNFRHAVCFDSKCSCEPGKVASKENANNCMVGAAHVGDSCVDEEVQCFLLQNTKCALINHENTCQCSNSSFVEKTDKTGCIPIVKQLDTRCNESVQCRGENTWCVFEEVLAASLKNGSCKCLNGFIGSQENPNSCIPIRSELGMECTEQIQCTLGLGEYSQCEENECRCKVDGFFSGEQCYSRVPFGGKCLIDEQCVMTSDPEGIKLACRPKYFAAINETIHLCGCPYRTHIDYEGSCYAVTGYGLNCSSDLECKLSSSTSASQPLVCHIEQTICGCPSNHIVSRSGTSCILESVSFGGKCQESRQCVVDNDANRFCNYEAGICSCKKDFEYQTEIEGGVCIKNVDNDKDNGVTKFEVSFTLGILILLFNLLNM